MEQGEEGVADDHAGQPDDEAGERGLFDVSEGEAFGPLDVVEFVAEEAVLVVGGQVGDEFDQGDQEEEGGGGEGRVDGGPAAGRLLL